MAKNKLQFYTYGSRAHEQVEHVSRFRESAAANELAAAIDKASTALSAVDAIMSREGMSDAGSVKDLIMNLASVKAKALGANAVAEAKRSTRPRLSYLIGAGE